MKMRGVMAAALMAGLVGMEPTGLAPERTKSPTPRYLEEIPRRQRKRMTDASAHSALNLANRLANERRRNGVHGYLPDPFARAVNALTNWQRNQWAKAGYPGLRQKDASRVLAFCVARAA